MPEPWVGTTACGLQGQPGGLDFILKNWGIGQRDLRRRAPSPWTELLLRRFHRGQHGREAREERGVSGNWLGQPEGPWTWPRDQVDLASSL